MEDPYCNRYTFLHEKGIACLPTFSSQNCSTAGETRKSGAQQARFPEENHSLNARSTRAKVDAIKAPKSLLTPLFLGKGYRQSNLFESEGPTLFL
jgi:hypothetical protein